MKNNFIIPVSDHVILEDVLATFNSNRNTNIKIEKIIDDEATLVEINKNGCSDEQLFYLAFYYGMKIQKIITETGRDF
jgi:hypothetical protein